MTFFYIRRCGRATTRCRITARNARAARLTGMSEIIHVASKDVAPLEIYPGARTRWSTPTTLRGKAGRAGLRKFTNRP